MVEDMTSQVDHVVTLDALIHSAPERTPYAVFRNVNDDFWFWVLTEGVFQRPSIADILPAMPPKEVQEHYTSYSGLQTLQEAYTVYRTFKELHVHHGGKTLESCAAILDFGCGWGRIIRFFLKDIEPARLFGADPADDMIDLCKRTIPWCQFRQIDPESPLPFADCTFDLIFSFAVFSHFSEEYHWKLLVELQRIVRPGGLLMVMTHGPEIFMICENMRKSCDLEALPPALAASADAFPDPQKAIDDYEQGLYCFAKSVAGWHYWGDAAISEKYVREHWSRLFTVVDYVNDRERCSQPVIVVRKELGAG
jgi:SAM-dependent methyltransferase